MKEKNTTFANEKSVLLINAKHCRIEKSLVSKSLPVKLAAFVSILFSEGKKK